MTHRGSTEATIHLGNEGTLQAIHLVESGQLVSHPVETGVFATRAGACSHKVDNFIRANFIQSFFDNGRPIGWVLVVVQNWVDA